MLIFFFNDTATTEIYTLSLHDALPIYVAGGDDEGHRDGDDDRRGDLPGDVDQVVRRQEGVGLETEEDEQHGEHRDRKSTRLNSSHANISYAVFCLKKKTV